MDLYLLSPVFLRKMIRRPSATAGEDHHQPEGGQDRAAASEDDAPRLLSHYAEGVGQCDTEASEAEDLDAIAWRRRRRSSLDRVLRQHAYIIICVFCYACSLLGHGT